MIPFKTFKVFTSVLLIKMLEEVWSVIILTRRGAVLLHGVVLTLVNNLIN